MKKDNKNLTRIKEIYNKYKELKKDPRKKAGIKLLGYFIFLFLLLLIATITNNIPNSNNNIPNNKPITNTTTITKKTDKYVEKQKKLLINKYNINYSIKYNDIEYKINGTLENNIINGYLEEINNIRKITIKDNKIFEISNNNENEIMYSFNINYINIEYILNLIKQTSAFIQEKDNIKTYLYEIENDNILTKIYLKTNEEDILEIEINDSIGKYLLSFDN